MNQEKIGKFIRELRKNNNLTQADLANKYNVTYQAVSKWENGKNIPDISILKQMSKDFNIDINDLLDGEENKKKVKPYYFIIGFVIVLFIILLIIIFTHNEDFEFKTLTTTCDDFTIKGSISYNKDKSSIYVSNIKYCGKEDKVLYDSISSTLYESHNNIIKKIDEYKSESKKLITLDDYLSELEFAVDNYESSCKTFSSNDLYIEILASKDGKTITYKIPLTLTSCPK
ncbi:MAG: helix-turn-helix domain-containing protein [Tenericutes bacterium]|nr:helix-turn-helix domain-containing protein [Mycoplasmatota bacterium]